MGGEGDNRDEKVGWHHQMGMSLSKLQELVMDREAWRSVVHGVTRVRPDLATKPPPPYNILLFSFTKLATVQVRLLGSELEYFFGPFPPFSSFLGYGWEG